MVNDTQTYALCVWLSSTLTLLIVNVFMCKYRFVLDKHDFLFNILVYIQYYSDTWKKFYNVF